jgi:hypothetical protein
MPIKELMEGQKIEYHRSSKVYLRLAKDLEGLQDYDEI